MSDLRNAIEAAMKTHATKEGDEENTETIQLPESVVEEEDPPAGGEASAPAPDSTPAEGGSEAPAPAPAAPAPAPATPTGTPAPAAPDASGAPTPSPAPGPNSHIEKPPGTWSPAAREKWATLDPALREEVWKRERETSRAMTMSADARKFSGEFERRVQPYLGFIAAENSTPLDAMENLMRMGAVLRVGTRDQKVAIVADTIKRFGVDLEALDSVLAGQQPQNNPQQFIQQAVQQAIQPFQQQLQQQQTRQQQTVQQQVNSEIENFANDPKNEFFRDVEHLIPDILEIAARQGQQMSLTQAYERAILMHDPVRSVVEARRRNEVIRQKATEAARKKTAGSSVTSSQQAGLPGPASTPTGRDSIRADIEAAIAAQQGR